MQNIWGLFINSFAIAKILNCFVNNKQSDLQIIQSHLTGHYKSQDGKIIQKNITLTAF